MMKLTLEFESIEDALPSIQATDMASLISDWLRLLRHNAKYGDGSPTTWEKVRQEFTVILNESDVTLELY